MDTWEGPESVRLIEVSLLYTGTLRDFVSWDTEKYLLQYLVMSVLGRLFLEKLCMTFW